MTVTGVFGWLGGSGRGADLERGERSGYAVTGAVVLLCAVVAGIVTGCALIGSWPAGAAISVAVLVAILTGAIGRALATAKPGRMPDRLGPPVRIGVAVLIGAVVAELAVLAMFGGTVDRIIAENARRAVDSAPAVVAARTELERARADRVALGRAIAAARTDIDRTLVIARCEFHPTPECPQTRITGVPGRGPEARTAEDMLDEARQRFTATQAKADPADRRVAAAEKALTTAESGAVAAADRGLGARWSAMNAHTRRDGGAFALRALTWLGGILLALLPLLLRWWRGETFFDRRLAARIAQDRADHAADTSISATRAEARAAAARLRAEQELTATRLAVAADAAIDRERERTRVFAAIGGLEIGIAEPQRRGELPAAPHRPEEPMTPNLPAQATKAPTAPDAPKSGGGLELPLIGTVPFTDTAARLIRPLVPSFVANAIDTATHPLRTARQAFEEVEEITFTLRRTRKVTVDTDQPVGHLPAGYPDPQYAHHIAATVVDPDYPHHYTAPPPALPSPAPTQLPGRTERKELPPAR
ncbi:DUF4407 domain-containing protein [Nocardia panacis]|uniref:DUF4407 domain-containing protein n=1 Tax=Nocardia panacis TaxID=2340916 RepID=A0A3A4KNX3_9NOCA|nr:DUF4407 domain-containing protein [Nocardia panacis]RJO77288.1 DUF4407 domain-containing protein [Nocardia panacis]